MAAQFLGKPVNRYEGRAKVTGRANYAADNPVNGVTYAVGVVSSVGRADRADIDAGTALGMPGVLGVWHAGNFPKVYRSPNEMSEGNKVGEVRPPFEDARVYYAGQYVAVVVAETFEQARAAARTIRVRHSGAKVPAVSIAAALKEGEPAEAKDEPDQRRGKPDAVPRDAVVVDATYTTPIEVHNPIELHASIARWDGDHLEMHESTQWVVGQRKALAKVLGIPAEKITVRSPYIGGGFGGKLFLWPHTVIAAVTARELGRPVKFVLERRNEFTAAGHRPETRQRLRLAADRGGKLLGLRHESISSTSKVHEFVESCASGSFAFYDAPNAAVSHRLAFANVGAPTAMRAPGAAPGSFALECAFDELAVALAMDPFELRRRTFSFEKDHEKNLPWSSNGLKECLDIVSRRFGWSRRNPEPGSMREGDEILGWGMAVAAWPSEQGDAEVLVQLRDDGTARVSCATQDIGTGTYTVIALTAAEVLGLPLDKIDVALGDSSYPPGPISGGSMVTATVVPVVADASRRAIEALRRVVGKKGGAFEGQDPKSLQWRNGEISGGGRRRLSFGEVLKAVNLASVEGKARSGSDKEKKFSFRSFGAHAVEVRWDPGIARLRVSRAVTAIDAGRVINRKGALNQIEGGFLMGLGMALLEESVYDARDGHVVTDNLADYLMPVNADMPELDVTLLDKPDPHIGEFGAKGMGEIGITGAAAAIVNAVYHATGRRIRDLPVRIEKLIA